MTTRVPPFITTETRASLMPRPRAGEDPQRRKEHSKQDQAESSETQKLFVSLDDRQKAATQDTDEKDCHAVGKCGTDH